MVSLTSKIKIMKMKNMEAVVARNLRNIRKSASNVDIDISMKKLFYLNVNTLIYKKYS